MKEPVVVDSTCLIGLERIRQIDILPTLFEPVVIPPEVNREFGVSLPWLNGWGVKLCERKKERNKSCMLDGV